MWDVGYIYDFNKMGYRRDRLIGACAHHLQQKMCTYYTYALIKYYMWQSHVENEHYSVSVKIEFSAAADTWDHPSFTQRV